MPLVGHAVFLALQLVCKAIDATTCAIVHWFGVHWCGVHYVGLEAAPGLGCLVPA